MINLKRSIEDLLNCRLIRQVEEAISLSIFLFLCHFPNLIDQETRREDQECRDFEIKALGAAILIRLWDPTFLAYQRLTSKTY